MSKHNRSQHCVYRLIVTVALAAAYLLPAFAQESHQFAIQITDAARAIQEFGVQAKLQILVSGEQLEGKRLNEVNGTLSSDAGLKMLLAGTGLRHEFLNDRTVVIVGDKRATTGAADESAEESVRVAQSGSTASES